MTIVGQVGCGRWGRLVLRDLIAAGASVNVVARGADAEHAGQKGALGVFARIRDLPACDGYVVVTPTSTHAAVIDQLLSRRAPIFCEKPLCTDVGQARILSEVETLFVMEKWRYHTGVQALKQLAAGCELGPVVGVRSVRLGYGHPHADVDCVWTLMPHDLSIAAEILGEMPFAVSALADVAAGHVMGMTAFLRTQTAWHIAEVGMRSLRPDRSVTVYFRDGTALLADAMADHILISSNAPNGAVVAPETHRIPIAVEMPLLAELKEFVGYLKGGPAPKVNARSAADIVTTVTDLRRLAGI